MGIWMSIRHRAIFDLAKSRPCFKPRTWMSFWVRISQPSGSSASASSGIGSFCTLRFWPSARGAVGGYQLCRARCRCVCFFSFTGFGGRGREPL